MKIRFELVVNADVELVGVETAGTGAGVIVVDAPVANIGQRHQLHQVHGWTREPACRNDIACKWLAPCCTRGIGLRIEDLVGRTAAQAWVEVITEIAVTARSACVMSSCRGHSLQQRDPGFLSQALVVPKVEELVFFYGTPDRPAKLIVNERGNGSGSQLGERIAGLLGIGPSIEESRTVDIVAA